MHQRASATWLAAAVWSILPECPTTTSPSTTTAPARSAASRSANTSGRVGPSGSSLLTCGSQAIRRASIRRGGLRRYLVRAAPLAGHGYASRLPGALPTIALALKRRVEATSQSCQLRRRYGRSLDGRRCRIHHLDGTGSAKHGDQEQQQQPRERCFWRLWRWFRDVAVHRSCRILFCVCQNRPWRPALREKPCHIHAVA